MTTRGPFDEKLAAALYDVPVPERLSERLLQCLARESELQSSKGGEPATESPAFPVPRSSFSVPRLSLRQLSVSAAALAAAAILLMALWLAMPAQEALSEQLVLDEAIRLMQMDSDQPSTALTEDSFPAGYPFSRSVLPLRGVKWRSLNGTFSGCQGVVYDLPVLPGASAALYVLDAGPIEAIGEVPMLQPFTTAGYCASAWHEDGLLYVLVVQGDSPTYRAYLNRPREPVA